MGLFKSFGFRDCAPCTNPTMSHDERPANGENEPLVARANEPRVEQTLETRSKLFRAQGLETTLHPKPLTRQKTLSSRILSAWSILGCALGAAWPLVVWIPTGPRGESRKSRFPLRAIYGVWGLGLLGFRT